MWKYFRTITLTKKDSAKDPKRNLFIRVCFLFGPIFMCLAHILHNLESAVMYFFVSLETIFFHYFCLFSWPCHMAYGLLVPRPETELIPLELDAQSFNHYS